MWTKKLRNRLEDYFKATLKLRVRIEYYSVQLGNIRDVIRVLLIQILTNECVRNFKYYCRKRQKTYIIFMQYFH